MTRDDELRRAADRVPGLPAASPMPPGEGEVSAERRALTAARDPRIAPGLAGHLRAAVRLPLFVLWALAGLIAGVSCLAAATAAPRAGGRLHAAIAGLWCRGTAALLGVRTTVHGERPRPPFVLVCNHLGYLDIVVLMGRAPAVFVSKAEVAGWPLLGALAKVAQTIFVDRGRRRDVVRVNELVAGVLRRGRGVIVFPEGTSSEGERVLPFRSSLLEPPVRLGLAVAHAALHYRTPPGCMPAALSVCWWGDMTFPGHFWRMLTLPRVEATLRFGERPLSAGDRQSLATALRAAVAADLRAVREAREGGVAPQHGPLAVEAR